MKEGGYGGAFVWTLDLDDFSGHCASSHGQKYPLIQTIPDTFGGKTEVKEIKETTPPQVHLSLVSYMMIPYKVF